VHRVLEHDDGRLGIPVDSEPVRTMQDHDVAVTAVQVGDRLAPDDPAGVAGHGDHELKDRVLREKVEEVLAVDETFKSLLDDLEERVQRREVGGVVDGHPQPTTGLVQAWRLRRTKSRKGVGDWPVTFSMSSLGVEPLPEMTLLVSQRSITA
jgi:hypothetical protein